MKILGDRIVKKHFLWWLSSTSLQCLRHSHIASASYLAIRRRCEACTAVQIRQRCSSLVAFYFTDISNSNSQMCARSFFIEEFELYRRDLEILRGWRRSNKRPLSGYFYSNIHSLYKLASRGKVSVLYSMRPFLTLSVHAWRHLRDTCCAKHRPQTIHESLVR